MTAADRRWWHGGAAVAAGVTLAVAAVDIGLGALCALALAAVAAWRARMCWVATCAAAWFAVLGAVRVFDGPYDSWAGRAVIGVLAGYVAAFLAAWSMGRWLAGRRRVRRAGHDPVDGTGRPELAWPTGPRLWAYLLVLLGMAAVAAALRFRGVVPPLFADNPDAARQVLRDRSSLVVGLATQAWTLGLCVSLLRAFTARGRTLVVSLGFVLVFAFGAALGASRNAVLVAVIPAVIAALSVRQPARRSLSVRRPAVAVALVGVAVVGAAVFLGGQRTLAGTGTFETEFRARYGDSALAATAGSLDLSLSSSVETFGRLWVSHESLPPAYGAYTLTFLGSRFAPLIGEVDLYRVTSQLSAPYYMNTATFAAIPLLDYGPVGAVGFLVVLGLAVGIADRRWEYATGPAHHLGRGFVVYFAVFGVYELYPFIQPIWLALVPGLWVLHRLGRRSTHD